MGQQAGAALLSIGGEIIGAFIGGPVGAVIGGLVGGLIGSLIFNRASKPYVPDVNLMQSSYGNPIPIIWGTVRVPATVIWMDQINAHAHSIGKGIGGGGGNAYSYWQDAMLAFCEGPATMVKLFLDGKLFIDNTAGGRERTSYTFAIRDYDGHEDQLPDWLYKQWVAQHVNPGDAAPAYRGLACLVFQKIDLAHFGTRFPQTTAVYTTNNVFTTRFAAFTPWADSISSAGSIGFSVDWIRQLLYTLLSDGTIRAFDLSSQTCVMERKIIDNSSGGSTTPFTYTPPVPVMLASGNGTNLYAVSGPVYITRSTLFAYGLVFFKIDPATLTLTGVFLAERNTLELPSIAVSQLICDITGQSLLGPIESLAGVLQFGGIFFVNVDGADYGALTYPGAGLAGGAEVQWGNPGTGDVWVASWNFFDPGSTLYLSKTSVNAPTGYISLTGPGPDLALSPTITLVPGDVGDTLESGPASFVYDSTDGTLVVTSVSWDGPIRSFKVNPNTHGIVWTSSTWSGGPFANTVLDNGHLSYASGIPAIPILNTNGATLTNSPNATSIIPNLATAVAYNSYINGAVFQSAANGFQIAFLQRVNAGEVPVADIITDICARVGLADTDIDVSMLTATVWGYAITSQKSAGAALADLCHVFQIDMVESDYKLKFVPRGQPPVATITQAELGSTDPQDGGKFWQAKKAQELEMPLQINVKYQDPNLDYNPGSSYGKRTALPVPTVFSKRKRQLDLPVVATALEARQIADSWLYTMWAERNTYDTVLSPKHLWLDPGDNVIVNLDNGSSYGSRGHMIQTGADLSIQANFNSEDATTYKASTAPGAVFGQQPQVVTQSAFGQPLLFNVPLLQDTDDTSGLATRCYFAAGSYSSATAWSTGGMYNSKDGGLTWQLLTPLPTAAPWGRATTALPNVVCAFATDRWNSVTVSFTAGFVPTGCSYEDMMNGVNPMLLGSEIIQFMTVDENEDGTITLSGLARGRRGTEWATGSHRPGEIAIMLSAMDVTSTKKALTEIGQPEQWIMVPSGRYIDQVPRQTFTYLGYDLFPYAPVNFARTPSGSDLVLSWKRRTRLGGLLLDGIDIVPLNETSEMYEAYVLPTRAALAAFNPTNSATYTRAFLGLTAPMVTYTAAEMAADGFSPSTQALYLVVYQLSGVVGRGFQGYKALPAF